VNSIETKLKTSLISREVKGGLRMDIKKIIFLDDTYFEDCILSNDIPKEIAEVSSSFVKLTFDKSTIEYVNLDYIQLIIPKNLKVISS